jgi:hypothetical protein
MMLLLIRSENQSDLLYFFSDSEPKRKTLTVVRNEVTTTQVSDKALTPE